jgi:hypothetical protein
MLFFRGFTTSGDLTVLNGGDRKVWDYFQHVEHSPTYRPVLQTGAAGRLAADNPWHARPDAVIGRRNRIDPQAYFVAGMNWNRIPRRRRRRPDRPIINLVQHIRHADRRDPKRPFLRLPAVRICVGSEVADAINATGEVCGPVITIPNGIDIQVDRTMDMAGRDIDIAVIGHKVPDFAREVAARLKRPGRRLHLIDEFVARPQFLDVLARTRLAVFVPRRHEGFYLPALEAMATGTPVVCPDSVGNRSFCRDEETCWFTPYDMDALIVRAETAWSADADTVERIRRGAWDEAARHDLANERRAFLDVLADLPALWAGAVSAAGSPV